MTNDEVLGVSNTAADLGYDEPAAPSEFPVPTPKKEEATPAPKAEEVKVETTVTGYGKKAEEVKKEEATPAPKVEEKKPEEMTDEEKNAKAIDDSISTLGNEYNKDKIKKFVTDHKLTKEQVDAYVAQAKADTAEAIKNNEERVKNQRTAWETELTSDPEFGGENFDKNIFEVEKTLEKHFPNVKKLLTDKKGMLPPSFMKDLLSVSKLLNPTNKFEGGEPPKPASEPTSFLDDMYS